MVEIWPVVRVVDGIEKIIADRALTVYAKGAAKECSVERYFVLSANSTVSGLGGVQVMLVSGGVSGSIVAAGTDGPVYYSHGNVMGKVEIYNPAGTKIGEVGLPLLSPVTFSNVGSMKIIAELPVMVRYTITYHVYTMTACVVYKVIG